jgi:hypothetical protein
MGRSFFSTLVGSAVAAGLLSWAGTAAAQSTWDLSQNCSVVGGGSCLQDNGGTSTLPDLTYQFTSGDGKIIQAAAFSTTSYTASSATLQADFLGFYAGNGLGVGNLNAPQHAVDNAGGGGTHSADNFIVFKFPTGTWNVTQLIESAFGTANLKMNSTLFFGTPTGALAGITGLSGFAGVTLAQLENASNGFQQDNCSANSGSTGANQTVVLSSSSCTNAAGGSSADSGNNDLYVVVAASVLDNNTNPDYFKVNSVTGQQGSTGVPEPSTMILLIAGAAGVYARRRLAGSL